MKPEGFQPIRANVAETKARRRNRDRMMVGGDGPMAEAKQPRPPFGGQSEATFLSRIRKKLTRDRDTAVRYVDSEGDDDDTLWTPRQIGDRFCREWQAAGGSVKQASTIKEVYALVSALCIRDGVKKLVYGGDDWSSAVGALVKSGMAVEPWASMDFHPDGADRNAERANQWDAGVLWVDYAVAETGSLVLLSRPDAGRSVSLLPPRLYALISPDTLVASRKTVFQRLSQIVKQGGSFSSATFITGPSRSADIEMDLSIGVHGPGEVTAILLEV